MNFLSGPEYLTKHPESREKQLAGRRGEQGSIGTLANGRKDPLGYRAVVYWKKESGQQRKI